MVEEGLTLEEVQQGLLGLLFQARKSGDPITTQVYEHCVDLLDALQTLMAKRLGNG